MKQFRLLFDDAYSAGRCQPLLGRTRQSCVAFACLALSLFIMGCSDSDSERFPVGTLFDLDGLSYDVINETELEVTGRASGNTGTDIVIPDTVSDGFITYSVTSIGTQAFEDNLLTSVIIGDRVRTLGEKAFKGNLLPSVVIPDSVTTLGEKAFEKNKLANVDIPPSVTTIELNAFNKNDLTRAAFRGSYGTFNNDTMFDNNTSLSVITYCRGALGWTAGNTFFNGSVSLSPTATTCPAAVSVDAPDEMGPYSVGHVRMEFIDVLRDNRSLPTDIWFPAAKADIGDAINTIYPLQGPLGIESIVSFDDVPAAPGERRGLVVFSHGFGGTNTQSTALMEHLASQGFIIVSPEHTGNTNSDRSDPNAAANRVPDVSFIIDSLLALNDSQGDRFFGIIDANKIGVLGHSGGGFTAIGAVAGYKSTPADARVKAVMPISAAISGSYSADDLALVSAPVLLVGGTLDVSVPIGLNDFAFDALVNAPQVIQVDVVGATHTHFANICEIASWLIDNGLTQDLWDSIGAAALTAPYLDTCSEDAFPIGQVLRLQNLYATAFFRYYLNGEVGYRKFLEQGYAESEPDIKFKSR